MSIENLGAVWPEWKVVELLGEGAYGKVYKMERESHGMTSTAAVKAISIPQNDAELLSVRAERMDEQGTRSYFGSIVTDFINEIKLMQSLKGTSNIVNVEDYLVLEKTDKIGWDIFIRMELLTPLSAYIVDKDLTEAEVIKLGQDVCSALELCARQNIIHRDIKPENIFVSPHGDFKVGDFGIARELEKTHNSLSQKGTYNYIAPEVTTSKHYDSTVDIYSLGLVLYKLLNNNRLPFLNPNAQLITYHDRKTAIDRRLNGDALPAPINASPQLTQVILTACAFRPTDRFQSPTAFKNALGAAKGEQPSSAPMRSVVASVDVNATTAVRRAPKAAQPVAQVPMQQADVFGKKKKSGFPALILLVLLAIGAFSVWFFDPFDFFAPSEHTVLFYMNDGTSEVFGEPVLVEDGDMVASPSDTPLREGYAFLYWTRDPVGNYRHNFASSVTYGLTLYAQWEENAITYTDRDSAETLPLELTEYAETTTEFENENRVEDESTAVPFLPETSPYDDFLGDWIGTFDSGNRVWGLELSVYRVGADYQATVLYFSDAHARTNIVAHYLADVHFNTFNNRFELFYIHAYFKPSGWSSDVRLYGMIDGNVFSGYFSTVGTAWLTRVAN